MVPLAMQSHRVVSGRLEGGARGGEGAEGRASKVFGPAAVGGKAGADGGQVVFVREPGMGGGRDAVVRFGVRWRAWGWICSGLGLG